VFPDGGDIAVVEKVGKVLVLGVRGFWGVLYLQFFEVMPSGSAAGELLLLLTAYETISGEKEAGYRTIKRTFLKEFPHDNLTKWSLEWGTGQVDFLANAVAISTLLAGEGFGGKGDGLIGRGTFVIKG